MLMLYTPINTFSVMLGFSVLEPVLLYKQRIACLVQGHNAVCLVRPTVEPSTPRFQVKQSITEPVYSSPHIRCNRVFWVINSDLQIKVIESCYFNSQPKHVVGTQKNHLSETFLLSTQNIYEI